MNVLRQPDDDDLFRYGYRYVARSDERGRQTFVMVPLTEEDVLHPQLEDHVTQNEPHDEDCGYIKVACQIRLAGNPNALVLHDCKIIWDIAGMGDHGPDIAVIFGARRGERLVRRGQGRSSAGNHHRSDVAVHPQHRPENQAAALLALWGALLRHRGRVATAAAAAAALSVTSVVRAVTGAWR